MSPEQLTAYTAIAVAGGSFIFAVWGTSWSVRGKFSDLEQKLDSSITARLDSHKRMVGETMTAMRVKVEEVERGITKVELWNRDNFVRRAEFSDAISAIRGDFNNLAGRMDRKLDNIHDKLDRMSKSAE